MIVPSGQSIAGAEADLVEAAEHVEERARDAGDAAHHGGVRTATRSSQPAAARSSGGGPVLPASFADAIADRVVQFGRERTAADPGGVRLHDAEHPIDPSEGTPVPAGMPSVEQFELVTNR